VAYSGQPAPGTSSATFSATQPLRPRGISNTGTLVFEAFLEGGDTQAGFNDRGLWIQQDGTLRILARMRERVPIHELPELGALFLSRRADVVEVMADEERFSPDRRLWEHYVPPTPEQARISGTFRVAN